MNVVSWISLPFKVSVVFDTTVPLAHALSVAFKSRAVQDGVNMGAKTGKMDTNS